MSEAATIFLISPANLSGKRFQMLLEPRTSFDLAERLRSAGAPLADVFSFVSGLYFRGKVEYARAFGQRPGGEASSFVMTAGGGLCQLEETVTLARLSAWQKLTVSEKNPHFTAPLIRHASELDDATDPETRFVLLGSVASNKYVAPLREVFGSRLLFPEKFAGLGDMARGSLLLRSVADARELTYLPVPATRRW